MNNFHDETGEQTVALLFVTQLVGITKSTIETKAERESLRLVYQHLDEWLFGGKIDLINEILTIAPVDTLPAMVTLGLLTSTYCEKNRLPAWVDLRQRFEKLLDLHFPESEKREILAGLE